MESSRKGREAIRSGLAPLGGDSEEKEEYTGREPPWGASVLGPTQGRQAPLSGWRATRSNRRAVGTLDSTHEEGASAGLLPKQGGEGRTRTAPAAAQFPTTALARALA